jgi:PAS domain S-box-containing protein
VSDPLAPEASAASLRAVVDAAASAIIGVDEEGTVRLFSPSAERLLGWSADEVIGEPVWRFAPTGRSAEAAALRADVRAGRTLRRDTELRRKDGELVEVHLSASPIIGEDGHHYGAAVSLLDISERRAADRSRSMLQHVIDHAPSVIAVKDGDGRIMLINRIGAAVLGREQSEVIGRTDFDLLPEELARRNREQERRVLATGEPRVSIEDIPLPGGGKRAYLTTKFLIPGTAGGVGVIASDLSELRRGEADRARLAALVRAAPDAIITEDRDGLIVTWNPGAERMFGVDARDAVGRPYEDVVIPEAEQQRYHALRAKVMRGEAVTERMGGRRADGSTFPTEVSAAPMMVGEAGTTGIVAIVRDITDLIDAELELRERAAQLERSNHDLEAFAYAASHDLQEPLRSIKMGAESVMLAASERLEEDERGVLSHVEQAADRMSRQVSALMQVARVSLGQAPAQPVPVEVAVDDALNALRAAIGDSDAEIRVERPLPSVAIPRTEMALVLQNVIGNAIRYHRPGIAPQVTISGAVRGGWVEVGVADNGVGLSEADRSHIFGMFGRAQPGVPGTGMGLAVCRRILQRRGGALLAESAGPGQGSRFIVRLPEPSG